MKTRLDVILVFLVVLILSGCASKHKGPAYHAGDENPPSFLVGAVGTVLTNFNGFSAHVAITTGSMEDPAHIKSGELLERDGRFIYQPTLQLKGKRARQEGGLFFIWNDAQRSGYVLSEALQGYAPINPELAASNAAITMLDKPGIEEKIAGHDCRRREATIPAPDGTDAHLVLWEAEDQRHFPVRAEWNHGTERMTLDFSEVRLELPPEQLFHPPDGFTSYPSAVALMNELIVRGAVLEKKSQSEDEFTEPSDVRNPNWHPTATGGAP